MSHAGDLLAGLLGAAGVTHIFGQPGGQTAALYDGIAGRTDVRHVLIRDERSGAYAADAFARLTGKPGICDVTVGPGTTKLADGLIESLNASVPLIAIVGELPAAWEPLRDKGVASQGFGQVGFLTSITKSTLVVPSVEALPDLVRGAFRIATTGRPGPVAVVVPHDVLDSPWDPENAARDCQADDRFARAPAFRPVADHASITEAAALLDASARPLIIAGGGVHASRATSELADLANRLGAVVVTSFTGKGSVDETAPLAAGVLNPLGSTASLELARQADTLFWCGCKVGQNTSHNWQLPLPHQATIQLDIDPAELGRTFRPSVALHGDARATLASLAASVREQSRTAWRHIAEQAIETAASERRADESSDAVPIAPQRVMAELAARMTTGDVVVSDASFSAGWIAAHLPARRGARDFLFARGQGGLGYAVPAAIGACAARPDDRVITVSGDGGFSYAIGELATHAQLRTRSTHIVLNNGSLGWLAMWQRLYFDDLRLSVDLEGPSARPSFAGAAASLGCEAFTVEHPADLAAALDRALASEGPAVIEVRIDPAATPIHSFRRRLAEGGTLPRPGTVVRVPAWHRSPPVARPAADEDKESNAGRTWH
ncbi:MAG TPA: thiamine pyrophosphate-binding protein [Streptosporangiaceae bacterium]|jgi:acetolactate synthase-1/2/3 large subunit|nr:thiamine pyrophosphate-binding protein [Streptosporangiaceae bacterium]